jgi:hypothetical protein
VVRSELKRRCDNIEAFFAYCGLREKRRFVFLDLESCLGFKQAQELLVLMGEWKLVVPVENEQYAIEPDWKDKIRKAQEAKAPPSPPPAPSGPPTGDAPPTPPPPAPPKKDALPPGPPPVSALRWFYRRLQLSEEDLRLLWVKRGLTALTCMALGYRSNPKANKEILLAMAEHYPVPVLVDCGLWKDGAKATEKAYPNPQFYGMSLVEKRDAEGKKVRDEDGKSVTECVWNNPILIPYFDEAGDLIHLRPHKGMMKDKPPRLYVARPGKEHLVQQAGGTPGLPGMDEGKPAQPMKQFAVITEGEFKAGALWQVLGDIAAVGSLPGITMAKLLFGDVEEWLEKTDVRQVVVAYDNEDKTNPELPGYKREETKRFDAEVWGRYLARQLAKEGYDAKVGHLPHDWRDAHGKADWDGRLAMLIHGAEQTGTMPLMPEDTAAVWEKVKPVARMQFLEVIGAAGAVHELYQLGLFESKEERLIKNLLENIAYEPKLPIGGDNEVTIARRLQRLCSKTKGNNERLTGKMRGFLMLLAGKYQEARGGYYVLKPLSERPQASWQEQMIEAADRGDAEVKRACELALRGIPERISDFYIRAHYVISRLNGTRCRLVTIHSMHGVTSKLLSLPSAPFSQPSKFREWLLDNISSATWAAGERELNALQFDVGRAVAYKDVAEVPIRGYHAESKLWFFKDVTYTPDGKELFADRNGIIWYEGQAYKLADTDHEKQSFRHQEPLMRPKEMASKKSEATELFREASQNLFDTVGGFDGYLALGAVLAYAAGPEIYENFSGFPGLWLHGETQQGKSSVARWLMRVWGYTIPQGLALKDSTKVGLSIVLQQYSSLPVFLEEFQPTAEEWQIEKMKNIFDRVSGSKKTFDEGDRKILAGAIVTGIATCRDAQVRNRYAHVQVSASNRLKNHYDWFQEHCNRFVVLGRFLMKRRKEFATGVIEIMREWIRSKDMEKIDERARVVHGASFAAFTMMNRMLNSWEDSAIAEFREHIVIHSKAAVKEIHEQVNVNQFWTLLLNAHADNAFGHTAGERQQLFKARATPSPAPSDLTPDQLRAAGEDSRKALEPTLLYLRPGPVIDMLRRYMRQQGRELALEQSDLRAQMKTRGYWVDPGQLGTAKSADGVHRMKFGHGSRTPQSCWCVDLEKHELGRRRVSDEEFQSSLFENQAKEEQKSFLPSDEWIDPRKGDLFALVDSLKIVKQETLP